MQRDLQLLFELGTLRFVPRTWNRLHNPGFADVSEHMFRMTWLAMILAKREKADVTKVLQLALFHDVTESRTGDVHTLTRHYVKRDDDRAIAHVFADTSLEAEAQALFREYKERSTLESKIVKDADMLDVDLELRELEARGGEYPAKWKEKRKLIAEHDFLTESGKKLWKEIYAADPYDWYADGIDRTTQR